MEMINGRPTNGTGRTSNPAKSAALLPRAYVAIYHCSDRLL